MNKFGFPELSQTFLMGQDLMYKQFNEVDFFVEDIESEHMYFNIFKNVFSQVKFEKIFPLGGKENVIEAAKKTVANKDKIYFVDQDFDGILETKCNYPNIFYLKKYSIENYLIQKESIFEIIRIKQPKFKDKEIEAIFDYKKLLFETTEFLKEMSIYFVVVRKFKLNDEYLKIIVHRDFDENTTSPYYKGNHIKNYIKQIETSLKSRDGRISINKHKKLIQNHFNTLEACLNNIPGKYLLSIIKQRLISKKLINANSDETFIYSLSKEFNPRIFNDIKLEVINFRNLNNTG
ncbi:DUF4435 domain-containing protein [Sphingobacterium lactis]|uniref:DUF4435 domain-containing protein n=1 Tax=Sphingobacterium lactis TaxID=797291 RepID=A0A1H5ZZ81_9SPHI|nr:DUF4435 domain-containing protein [Sphingobacterium lactis]SEG41095.1 Protein of unknown function [Sphingobacterium lactis]